MTCVWLTWNASTTPGVGYHIWQGTTSGQYTVEYNAGPNLFYQVSGLAPGVYYFAATAYNSNGDSVYSNEVSKTLPLTTIKDLEQKLKEQYLGEKIVTIPDVGQ